ncbi:FG-GAP repeat domain-containing protein [Coraliomargarita parva]|uniref:FG-GAP repeat domain-containing protein n=1 Tax=Coraliomargarita parva TaxID=3014050 RepID=UPI0022B3C1C2|nr:VCBS repeat-containing protein [Coraliomargarita parva]
MIVSNAMFRSSVCALGLASSFILQGLPAEEGRPELSPFAFRGPDVLKVDWAARSLCLSDLNGDGLNDFAVINNDAARIDLFFQLDPEDGASSERRRRLPRNRWEPVMEDAAFEPESITVGFPLFDLVVGDLNGDGRMDLAYSAREVPLTVRYQSEAGGWSESREFEYFEPLGWINTLALEDLDADGDAELVALSADALRVFHPRADGDLGEPAVYPLTGENPYNLMVCDVNGDDLLDVLYIATDGKQALSVREQAASGTFGPERRFIFERPVRGVRQLPSGPGTPVFCAIDSRSGGLEIFSLNRVTQPPEANPWLEAQAEIYPLLRKGRSPGIYALEDLDGDGREDVLIANPEAAELTYYQGQNEGFVPARVFPTFSDVSSMVVARLFDSRENEVVLVSASEKIIGLSTLDASGRLSFPRQIPLESGEPLACAAIDADADGHDELAVVVEVKGVMHLRMLAAREGENGEVIWEELSDLELTGVRRKPSAIRLVDVFEGNRSGLMVFVPREAPVLLSAQPETPFTFEAQAGDSSIRESLLKDVSVAQISVFDVDGDGRNELIVGRKGFARAIGFVDGELMMVDQFNARRNDDQVGAIIPLPGDARVDRLMLYIPANGEFQFLERDSDGVFRYTASNLAGRINLVDWSVEGNHGAQVYFLAGEDRFWRFSPNTMRWEREALDTYETDLDKVHFNDVAGSDFDGDGNLDLVAVDGTEHVVEVLTRAEPTWKSRMYWQIFEQNMHYQGRTGAKIEPRQILTGDINGDQRDDLVFLIHDRILVYPQE